MTLHHYSVQQYFIALGGEDLPQLDSSYTLGNDPCHDHSICILSTILRTSLIFDLFPLFEILQLHM